MEDFDCITHCGYCNKELDHKAVHGLCPECAALLMKELVEGTKCPDHTDEEMEIAEERHNELIRSE
jgi:hypothetical protein